MTGAGAEWPKLYGFLGPVPSEFRTHNWTKKIKKGFPDDLPKLYSEFYEKLGTKIANQKDKRQELVNQYSFGAICSKILNVKFELLGSYTDSIYEILPSFNRNLDDENLKECLVIAGIPKITSSLTYTQPAGSPKLSNITILSFSSQILLLKEFVENRGGRFLYFHTEDHPDQIYDPAINPYFMELFPLKVFDGDLSSVLGADNYWRKFDGKHFEMAPQKVIGQKLAESVGNML